ncbi:hypothetical protein ACFLQI_01805 [Candidatus Undinarchaeota archaeon]
MNDSNALKKEKSECLKELDKLNEELIERCEKCFKIGHGPEKKEKIKSAADDYIEYLNANLVNDNHYRSMAATNCVHCENWRMTTAEELQGKTSRVINSYFSTLKKQIEMGMVRVGKKE